MTKETVRRLHRIYGILVSVMTVAAGICLMVACVTVYRSGEQPYSRQAVAEAFVPIAVPVYLCLALVVGGCLLQLLLPVAAERARVSPAYGRALERLYARVDVAHWEPELSRRAEREQKRRRLYRLVTAVVTAAAALVFFAYALDAAHFSSSDVTGSVIRAMHRLLPCVVVPFAWAVFAAYAERASLRRELTMLKEAPMKAEPLPDKAEPQARCFPEAAVRYGVLTVGLGLLIYGFATGGIADVLTKAVNICTECIGLG